MAGRQKKQRMIAELSRLAREHLGDETPDDEQLAILRYLEARVASGTTLVKLAEELSLALGTIIWREQIAQLIAQYDEGGKEASALLSRARARGAHALVEQSISAVENVEPTRDAIQKAKLVADTKMWVAERWNRAELGAAPKVQIDMNFGAQHLDALRRTTFVRPAAEVQEIEGNVIASAIASAPRSLSAGTTEG